MKDKPNENSRATIIPLTETLRLAVDDSNITLQKRVARKDKDWVPVGYYTNPAAALRRAALLDAVDGVEAITLAEYAGRLQRAMDRFQAALDASPLGVGGL